MVLVAYLLGSIPFGYLIVQLTGGGDVRATGSGGTGATNVTRRAGKGAGVLTLLLDALKGALAVALARWLLAPDFAVNWWVAACALAAVLGHIFPVWLGFRGGKGVATGLGVFLLLAPLAVAMAGVSFLLIVWLTRYVSLGSMVAALTLPPAVWLANTLNPDSSANMLPLLTTAIIGCAFIVLMHRANIGRLMRGTENKLKL
jgi:glycerol-3-phosphate acyltransferase PlsY